MSERQIDHCDHGYSRAFCATCLRAENERLRERVQALEAALLDLAFAHSAMDGKGPCWCKHSTDDYCPRSHSARCLRTRAAMLAARRGK